MQVDKIKKFSQIGLLILAPLVLLTTLGILVGLAHAQEDDEEEIDEVPFINLIENGNFEDGFYPVPELGFEPPDVGQVPIGWNWFKNEAYGKYNIYNQEGFGLICPGDLKNGYPNASALSIDMQSTDQPEARLGVYHTVDVVPGQDYLFSISGTIQSMQGSPKKSDESHKVELVFDLTGGSDWRAIPNEKWTRLPWGEYRLEFKTSGPDDPDIAPIESYQTVVRAHSNKMTIFLAAYRKWPDWRYVRYTFDCISLAPVDQTTTASLQTDETAAETTPASTNGAQEAAAEVDQPTETAPAEEPAIIPDSGGVPERDGKTTLLIIAIAVVILLGLLGAGIWNIRRRKTT